MAKPYGYGGLLIVHLGVGLILPGLGVLLLAQPVHSGYDAGGFKVEEFSLRELLVAAFDSSVDTHRDSAGVVFAVGDGIKVALVFISAPENAGRLPEFGRDQSAIQRDC